jgi:hypothetical protein
MTGDRDSSNYQVQASLQIAVVRKQSYNKDGK